MTQMIMNRRDQDENSTTWVDDGKHFANKKLRGKVFTGRMLANADFRGAELIECIFDNCDLTGAKFHGANCYGASFKKAKCYKTNFTQAILTRADFDAADLRGITITMSCDTFDSVKLPKKWRGAFAFMLAITDLPVDDQKKLEEFIGPEEFKLWHVMRQGI